MADRKRKGKAVSSSSQVTPRFKTLYHEAHFNSKLSARRILPELILQADEHVFNPIRFQIHQRKWEPRAKNPRQTRQTTPPQQQPQVQHQQEFPAGFYTHFDTTMSQIHRKLDQYQEENRRSFEAINTRMNQMDDQLSFLCYSNQMADEQMLFPYRNTTRQFKEMEMQGIPVNMANLAIHRQKEEEMNQERMRCERILQEAAAQQARNKGKSREVVPDSEDEFISSESEEF
ncbi:hypothetical protein PIB30_074357 [Stylosanthes scabra]|uniref:Uncharacterized protein n=1 Tax=Stylosanthes scabra TaxID=79078 RepID=A0ABU6VPW3_9FABA|nr:hypothetical protein [Stylosanthes scabra]